MSKDKLVYLDSYMLQQDMRIRMPKSILANLNIKKGETEFEIYLDSEDGTILLKPREQEIEK